MIRTHPLTINFSSPSTRSCQLLRPGWFPMRNLSTQTSSTNSLHQTTTPRTLGTTADSLKINTGSMVDTTDSRAAQRCNLQAEPTSHPVQAITCIKHPMDRRLRSDGLNTPHDRRTSVSGRVHFEEVERVGKFPGIPFKQFCQRRSSQDRS